MRNRSNGTTRRSARIAVAAIVVALLAAACSAASDEEAAAPEAVSGGSVVGYPADEASAGSTEEKIGLSRVADGDAGVLLAAGDGPIDARVIRDGSIELRIDPGSFGSVAAQVRVIATDLGGYVASGESRVEEYDAERYAVGWFTIRVPVERFDDAVARLSGLGENVSSSLSSRDVTEEYVDLEGRLDYWREQEAFYTRLMREAETIDDLVTIQTRMQDVLLNIEQIEGRLRYLDARTQYATLTVGLTEVPGEPVLAGFGDGGPIARAFAQAGEVLVATVAFLIVGTAVLIPIGVFALFMYLLVRLFLSLRRREETAES